MQNILDTISPLEKKSVEEVIKQIRILINTGAIVPGDRLPAERKLAEKFNVSRSTIRTAIKRMEFLKLIKTLPQSGSVVLGVETQALGSLFDDILKIDNCDFFSLVEMRAILEVNAVRFAAIRRTNEDLENIKQVMMAYEERINLQGTALEEDFKFHLTIAEASKNTVLKSVLQTIVPDIMMNYSKYQVCSATNPQIPISEHQRLYEYIRDVKPDEAAKIMSQHLAGVLTFAKTQNDIILS